MLPEEDRQALKKNGYISTNKGIKPIDSPLQTHNPKSFSTEAQHHRQGERDPIKDSRATQPKATPTASNTRHHGSADAEERRHAGSSLKPKPTPNLRGMSADGAEHWSNPTSSKKPASKVSGTMSPNATEHWSGSKHSKSPGIMSADGAEHWSNPTSSKKPASKVSATMSPNATEHWSNSANRSKSPSKVSGTMSPNATEHWSGSKHSKSPGIMSADGAEHWSNPTSSKKPASKVSATMSPNATEHWSGSEHSSIKPKPIPGSAADLAEARKELQQRRDAEQSLRKANKGGIFGAELRDLQRETSIAEARVNASQAAKKLQDFPTQAQQLKSNNQAIREEPRSDRVQQANSAKERYMGTLGLDSSGQPIKFTPRPPAPQQSKLEPEKSWLDRARDSVTEKASNAWDKTKSAGNYVKDHAETIGHTALDVGGMIPVAGAAFDGAHAAWYLAKGDKVNAALSAASAVPFIGDAAMAAKYGAKAVKGVEKLAEAGNAVRKTTDVAGVAENGITKAKDVSKLAQVVKDARVPKTHITYTLRDSDEVVRYAGLASGKGTPQEVLEKRLALDKGSKKHHIIKEHGEELKGGEARLEGVHGSRAAAEGGEDVLYSRYQIRGKDVPKVVGDKEVIKHELTVTQKGGREVTMGGGANYSKGSKILLNRQNPVSENSSKIRNPFTFGAKSSDKVTKDSGFEKIKAYAEDLREESVFGRVEYSRKLD